MNTIKKEQGFTLIEVIMAVSILTVGILAVASMQMASIRGNKFSGDTSVASNWAVTHIESLMNLSYDDPQLSAGSHPTSGTVTEDNGKYQITWDVTDNSIISGTKTVVLTVKWMEYGAWRNVTMNFTLGQIV